nr:histone-like nucleoid-structuring protein, MvaT/MvaU family [Pseudomonas juntendi]
MEALKGSSALQKELEFEDKLRSLLDEYDMSLRNVVNILDPHAGRGQVQVSAKAPRKEREVKRYQNPHTGEVVETKGGNHKILKEWKAEHGNQEVESWVK